jgi:hypothetical protein
MRALHTPQQETNSAYNPGVTFQGGQFLAQGISQAGNAITEGLQRYAANKQESAALDMRFEGTAKPLMEKLKLYGQLADENSPAAALLDKSADWHKLGNNQKKVLLADMLLLGDKTEAEQRRKEAEQYKLLEIQDRQAQFDELKQQHAFQRGQAATDTLFRGLSAYQDNRRLGLSERSTALAEQTHADTLKRFATQQQEFDAQRAAMGGMMRDFNQFAEGPQFNGTGMQRPMGQFEAYRRAAAANPKALSPQMMDDIGRMAVSEDRLGKPGAATSEPSIFVSPNGRTYIRHGNNPLVRDKTDEEIEAELAAKSAPRAMAPEGSVEAVVNGVKVLVGPDGRIYKLPSANPLAELLNRAGAPAAAPSPTWGAGIANWWNGKGSSAPATNAPPAAPSGAPVVRWGLDANGNPVKLR